MRAHIGKIVEEQEASGVDAFYVVTTFADPSESNGMANKTFSINLWLNIKYLWYRHI